METYVESAAELSRGDTDWSAIWAGVFSFFSIWVVFGAIGLAVFSKVISPQNLNVGSGFAIWTAVLTIIGMYVAGRVTSLQALPVSRGSGIVHGMTVFGLAAAIGVVLLLIVSASLSVLSHGVAGTQSPYAVASVSGLRGDSAVLLLSWIAALLGASGRVKSKPSVKVSQIRPAA